MNKIFFNILILTVIPLSASATEFAALAIDKGNGSAYGWSYNQPSLSSAETYAQNECSKRSGKNCSVVLSWSGEGCGVYRTVDKKLGTAYGWGIAKTQAEADKTANQEVLKRSNGVNASNFVWACNTNDKNKLKVLKNDNQIVKTVKIGSQVWMAENLNVSNFQNGDLIPLAKNAEEWRIARDTKKPVSRILDDTASNAKKYGRYYNWLAATDPRGICPTGFHLPTKSEWEMLIRTLGDTSTLGKKLKSRSNWRQVGWSGTDDYGFNALPAGSTGSGGSFDGVGGVADFWSSTKYDEKYIYNLAIFGYKPSLEELSRYPHTTGLNIRCIQD